MNASTDTGGMLPAALLDPSALHVDGAPASGMPRTPGIHDVETRLADIRRVAAERVAPRAAATRIGCNVS